MGKRKVAIVSFFKSENYGATLQAYALQQAISLLGYQPYYLDYERELRLPFFRRILYSIYTIVRSFLGYKRRKNRTRAFINQNIKYCSFVKEVDFDIYVVGSDQVWFPGYVSDFFLLKFVKNKKKISYASSFGVSQLEPSYHEYYLDALSSFSAISTREDTGKDILASLGFDSRVVLDPTLLFTNDYWDLKSKIPSKYDRYILCYVMNGDTYTAKFVYQQAQKVSRKMDRLCKILIIGDKEYKSLLPGYNLVCDAGPSEFLGLIKNAHFVITSSFHGTCFSILFEKNFINILRQGNPVNNRIEELNRKLGLSGRIYYTSSDGLDIDTSPIQYEPVRVKLDALRKESFDYLRESIN